MSEHCTWFLDAVCSIKNNRITKTLHDGYCPEIVELKCRGSKAWLEIIYEGDEIAGDLSTRLDEAVAGSGLEILRVKNNRALEHAMSSMDTDETLDDLDPADVFQRCLAAHEIPEDQRPALLSAYSEIIVSLNEADAMAD